jgi:hypothetical protein
MPGRGRPFQKGDSRINRAGRPRLIVDAQELAKQNTSLAIDTLVAICTSKRSPAMARIMAANSLLNRAHGLPPQGVEIKQVQPPGDSEPRVSFVFCSRKPDGYDDQTVPENAEPRPN